MHPAQIRSRAHRYRIGPQNESEAPARPSLRRTSDPQMSSTTKADGSPMDTDTDVLRDPLFRFYLLGRLTSQLVTRMQAVVVGWHIYEFSGDPVALGYVGLVLFVPMVLFGLIIGDWADRVSRSFLLTVSGLILGLGSAGFLVLSMREVTELWPYLALTGLFGVGAAFNRVAMPALLPQILPPAHLASGVAWTSSVTQFAIISGPSAAGVLLIFGRDAAYGSIVLLAVLSTLVWSRMDVAPARPDSTTVQTASMLERVIEGVRFVGLKPLILGAILLDLFAVLLGGVTALLPVFAKDILHAGPMGLGLLRSAPAVGAVLMALLLARRPLRRHAGPLFLIAVAVHGIAILAFGLSTDLTVSCLALGLAGSADMVSVVVRNTVVQLSTPTAMQGRVNAVNQIVISASNELGDFRAGLMAGLFGAVPVVAAGALAILGVTALGAFAWPPLRRLDRMHDLKPDA